MSGFSPTCESLASASKTLRFRPDSCHKLPAHARITLIPRNHAIHSRTFDEFGSGMSHKLAVHAILLSSVTTGQLRRCSAWLSRCTGLCGPIVKPEHVKRSFVVRRYPPRPIWLMSRNRVGA